MNRYAELDRELQEIHRLYYVVDADRSPGKIEELAFREAEICAEMRRIDTEDHAQVEEYRKAMGWKPCLRCQEKEKGG